MWRRHRIRIRTNEAAARADERELARRSYRELVRSVRERHAFADLRVQLADDLLARRLRAA